MDILFSNAGWNVPQAAEAIRDEDWDALMELNVTSSMVLTRALAPGMMQRQWGRIIYTSSILAFGSTPERVAYSTTKSALLGMVKANALRLGPHGITVNALAPGPFATEMPMSILTPEQQKTFAARTAWDDGVNPRARGPGSAPGQRRRQLPHRQCAGRGRRRHGAELLTGHLKSVVLG